MEGKYRFYKTAEHGLGERWFIDLPEWEGDVNDLEMVEGADAMLEIMAQGETEVHTYISTEHRDGWTRLDFLEPAEEIGGGYYFMKEYKGIDYDLRMWLCAVTEFVFGELPQQLWIKT